MYRDVKYEFNVVVGDTEVSGYQMNDQTVIESAIDLAPPPGCSENLCINSLNSDKEFIRDVEEAISNQECSRYENKMGI